jgi:uncharacterized protein
MSHGFLDIAGTRSVKAAQAANGSEAYRSGSKGAGRFDRFSDAEAQFIAERDSFYMATVSETGWPYVQHRGGPPGFLRLIDDRTLPSRTSEATDNISASATSQSTTARHSS